MPRKAGYRVSTATPGGNPLSHQASPSARRVQTPRAGQALTQAQYRALQAKRMLEAELDAEIVTRIKAYGLWSYHTHRSDRSEPGFPDRVIVGTAVIYRELKKQDNYATAEQRRVMDLLRKAGQDVDVWKPADLLSGRIDQELRAISPRFGKAS